MKFNHLLGADSRQPAHSCMVMKQLTSSQHWEEVVFSAKEAIRIIHAQKEWAAASLPEEPPVTSPHCAQCYLSSLGTLDNVKHGFKSVTHKHEGPAAVLLVVVSSCYAFVFSWF